MLRLVGDDGFRDGDVIPGAVDGVAGLLVEVADAVGGDERASGDVDVGVRVAALLR